MNAFSEPPEMTLISRILGIETLLAPLLHCEPKNGKLNLFVITKQKLKCIKYLFPSTVMISFKEQTFYPLKMCRKYFGKSTKQKSGFDGIEYYMFTFDTKR